MYLIVTVLYMFKSGDDSVPSVSRNCGEYFDPSFIISMDEIIPALALHHDDLSIQTFNQGPCNMVIHGWPGK